MFSQQHNIPKQHYRVEHYPDITELKKFIEQAESIKGVKHCFCWREQEMKKHEDRQHVGIDRTVLQDRRVRERRARMVQ